MIPELISELLPTAKYLLLENDIDEVLKGDEYYNNFKNKWLPVQKEFIGYIYLADESKPIRRKNKFYKEVNDYDAY